MDRRRRRFVPSPEGLESRAVLSQFGFNGTNVFFSPQPQLNTAQQQARRINNLPNFFKEVVVGRQLNKPVIKQLQQDLRAIQDKFIYTARPDDLQTFNQQLRAAMPLQNINPAQVKALNYTFGKALLTTGANPTAVANLQRDMNEIVKMDMFGPLPVTLMTNDYALVLQTALAVGHPIQRPAQPMLAVKSSLNHQVGSRIAITPRPTLIGTYHVDSYVQIVNAAGQVLGQSLVRKNGDYSVQFKDPLAPGLYRVFVRGLDAYGDLSHNSPPFAFRVVARHHPVTVVGAPHPVGPSSVR